MIERCKFRKAPLWAAAIGLTWLANPLHAEVALCATEQAISCTPYEQCDRSLPGAMNLPLLMKVDIGMSEIVSMRTAGEERTSKIATIAETDEAMLIHGADSHRPWVLQIDKSSGRFTGTIAGNSVAFVLFGECSWDEMQ
ncbi:MAG: hypothetical protein JKP97_16480 [Rhodobacteraceae bacterium]|nr:hypothetical protein [Paracoccaceae bacterium]